MDTLLRDVRHAVRNLVRSPGFAMVTILTLGLGIGANTAIFSVVNAVILRPLGYPQPERLIYISSQFPQLGFDQFWVSPPEFMEFQERTRTFSSVGAFASGQANLTAPDRPRRVNAVQASYDLFKTLGVNPLYGRTFEVDETRPNGAPVTSLSYELWKSASGGSPASSNAIRATLRLSSPAWLVQPKRTSSTASQSTWILRSINALIGTAARSSVRTKESAPP